MNLSASISNYFKYQITTIVLRRLDSLGVHIEVIFVVRERARRGGHFAASSAQEIRFLHGGDIEILRTFEPDDAIRRQLLRWFGEGKRCIDAFESEALIAAMWIDLEAFYHPPALLNLSPHEAYLFAAYVDPKH